MRLVGIAEVTSQRGFTRRCMHATGEYTIADLMEAFSLGRPRCLGGVLYALVPVPGIVVDLPD